MSFQNLFFTILSGHRIPILGTCMVEPISVSKGTKLSSKRGVKNMFCR